MEAMSFVLEPTGMIINNSYNFEKTINLKMLFQV